MILIHQNLQQRYSRFREFGARTKNGQFLKKYFGIDKKSEEEIEAIFSVDVQFIDLVPNDP